MTQSDIQKLFEAGQLAGFTNSNVRDLKIETWKAGIANHIPSKLPMGNMAVYLFFHNKKCLKVGKVGSNSNARYTSHHYNPKSSQSNLASSLIKDKDSFPDMDVNNIGHWIKENTTRYNLLIPEKYEKLFLNFSEAFFILMYNPRYEGG